MCAVAFDPVDHYQKNREHVRKLRALIGEEFYETAVYAALGLVAGEKGATMEQYQGAQSFLKHLNSLTLDPIKSAPPLTARVNHDTDYARRKPSNSKPSKSSPKPPGDK